jgi:hypothetical protein
VLVTFFFINSKIVLQFTNGAGKPILCIVLFNLKHRQNTLDAFPNYHLPPIQTVIIIIINHRAGTKEKREA